jgi:ankyrin repeat protein
LMVAAHRGHTEMVHLLLREGNADTTLADSYGKKAIDRAHSSHISYLIATASIENRMKDLSTTLNLNEYSPERNTKGRSRSRIP